MCFLLARILACLVEPTGLEPVMHKGGGFTVHWGYQFSYDSIIYQWAVRVRLARKFLTVIPTYYSETHYATL